MLRLTVIIGNQLLIIRYACFQEKWDEITEDIETVFGRGEEADKAR